MRAEGFGKADALPRRRVRAEDAGGGFGGEGGGGDAGGGGLGVRERGHGFAHEGGPIAGVELAVVVVRRGTVGNLEGADSGGAATTAAAAETTSAAAGGDSAADAATATAAVLAAAPLGASRDRRRRRDIRRVGVRGCPVRGLCAPSATPTPPTAIASTAAGAGPAAGASTRGTGPGLGRAVRRFAAKPAAVPPLPRGAHHRALARVSTTLAVVPTGVFHAGEVHDETIVAVIAAHRVDAMSRRRQWRDGGGCRRRRNHRGKGPPQPPVIVVTRRPTTPPTPPRLGDVIGAPPPHSVARAQSIGTHHR